MVFLIAKLLKINDLPEAKWRAAYGKLSGLVGIFFNICLFLGKFIAGSISGSIAITADAFNNLSDAASSIVAVVGFKLSEQKPDSEHPYGHGRIEYLAGLVVAAAIIATAIQLLRDSVDKLMHPTDIEYSLVIVCILVASILVKLYMGVYNIKIADLIDSSTVRAVAKDSFSDCITTSVVLVSTCVNHFYGLRIDGVCGIFVGFMILITGYSAGKETVNPLLGQQPEAEYIEKIRNLALNFDSSITGIHDLRVHDYGPGRRFVSFHAEVPADGSLILLHEVVDSLERVINEELGCDTTIHLDPVVTKEEYVVKLRHAIDAIVTQMNIAYKVHDFRVENKINHVDFEEIWLIFDLEVPYSDKTRDEEIKDEIRTRLVESMGEKYKARVIIDRY